jgi:probable rRNA maturation factor
VEDEDYHIAIRVEPNTAPLDAEPLRDAVCAALRLHHVTACQLSLVVVDDARIAALNTKYLGRADPTDCLAFDLRDVSLTDAVEGEIVVSWETARREAAARELNLQAELTLYVIHGLLHLLGYDDRDAQQAARMHRTEDRILTSLGLGPVYGEEPR